MLLKNKVALITGAASGIGKEIAEVFAREGAKVAVADLRNSQAEIVAAQIQARDQFAMPIGMDVTSEEQVDMGVAKVIQNFGGIDILVSNAGSLILSPLEQFSYDDWKKILEIHLDGAFLTTRACLKSMYTRGTGGSIIYMGSVHSKEGSKMKAPYVTAKHGLLGLCKVVAKEGAKHNVRANVICPGYVQTPMAEKVIPEQARALGISEEEVIQRMLKDNIDGQFTTTMDVADVALFFASFKTNALTGQSLIVSHGWHME